MQALWQSLSILLCSFATKKSSEENQKTVLQDRRFPKGMAAPSEFPGLCTHIIRGILFILAGDSGFPNCHFKHKIHSRYAVGCAIHNNMCQTYDRYGNEAIYEMIDSVSDKDSLLPHVSVRRWCGSAQSNDKESMRKIQEDPQKIKRLMYYFPVIHQNDARAL